MQKTPCGHTAVLVGADGILEKVTPELNFVKKNRNLWSGRKMKAFSGREFIWRLLRRSLNSLGQRSRKG